MTCGCIVGVQWPRWARPDLGVLLLAGELTCAVMRCSVFVLWVDWFMSGPSEARCE